MHPKSENILKVIRNFESVLTTPGAVLGMSCPVVNKAVSTAEGRRYHPCGTVHCHAGWYAVATMDVTRCILSYNDGITMMAKDLGLYEVQSDGYVIPRMMRWAIYNPEIWGNENASSMFSSKKAFISPTRPQGAENLQDIVNHWKEVYERVKATEAPIYEDITKELAVLPVQETPDNIAVDVHLALQ